MYKRQDVDQITRMLAEAFLSIFKDGLTLIGLLSVMFFQNWKLSLIAIIMIPLATIIARQLGKRMGKVTTQAQEKSGDLNRYLIDLFKNHKIISLARKIFLLSIYIFIFKKVQYTSNDKGFFIRFRRGIFRR